MKNKGTPDDLTCEEDKKFRDTLINVIEQTLAETLGKPGAKATFLRLERDYQLRKETIPENLEIFHNGINKILGSGALVIEKHIIRTLYACLFHGDSDFVSGKQNDEMPNFTVYVQNLRTASK
jgi:hypothetical protein